MIVTDRFKSYSVWTAKEFEDNLARDISIMTDEEIEHFLRILDDTELESDAMALEVDRDIVSIEDWINDDYYMGTVGKTIYKPWKDDLLELFESEAYSQSVIVGGIGSGKSTFSHLATLRMVYEASCLKDPALSYGIASGSVIGFCNLATSRETARRVVFEGISSKMAESPYFKYDFPPIKNLKNEIIFPKGIHVIAGSSTDTSVIGQNIFGGIIDEGNFMQRIGKQSMNDPRFKFWGVSSRAGRLYDSIHRRMKSRYLKKGKLPGILLIISSKTTKDSFTEQLIRRGQSSGSTEMFVRDRNIIEVKREAFDDKDFRVLVGTENFMSKILEDDEEVPEGGVVLDIPIDLKEDFENNIEEALRDIAGVSTIAISNFIQRVDKVDEMIDPTREHPFVCPLNGDPTAWDSRLPYRINWHKIATQIDGEWQPRLNPHAKRHVHFDPALTGDAFGLAIVHIAGKVPVGFAKDMEIQEYQPMYEVDFVLKIQGEPGNEIIFRNVRKMVYQFSDHGFHLAEFGMDSFQSREMVQALEQQGYKAGIYSMDTGQTSRVTDGSGHDHSGGTTSVAKAKQAYWNLRTAIYENRIRVYDYPILFRELKRLEDGPLKVDHPEGESKDLADALGGAVWTLFRSDHWGEPMAPLKGLSKTPEDGMVLDENFISVKTKDDAVVEENITQQDHGKYKKKKPKRVAPKYQKVSHDGNVEDLVSQNDTDDLGNFFVKG